MAERGFKADFLPDEIRAAEMRGITRDHLRQGDLVMVALTADVAVRLPGCPS